MPTLIEWASETINIIGGCTPVSEGCLNCYAARLAATRLRHLPLYAGVAEIVNGRPQWTGHLNFNLDPLRRAAGWRKPRPKGTFVADMSDIFHEKVSQSFLDEAFAIMEGLPQQTFHLLTKRPQRMSEFIRERWGSRSTPPGNIWLGVTSETQRWAAERIPILLKTPAAVRFVSCEPLLGPIHLPWLFLGDHYLNLGNLTSKPWINWVVTGGETGPNFRPMFPEWARIIRDDCRAAGVLFFFKQMGGCKTNLIPIPEDLNMREHPLLMQAIPPPAKAGGLLA